MGVSRRPGDGGAGRPASRTAFASTEERTVLVRVAARYGGFPVRPLGGGFGGLREGARRRPGSGDRPRDPPRNSASGDRIADYAARHRRGAGVGGGGHREGAPVLRRLAPPAVAPARPDAGTRRRTDAAAAPGPGGAGAPPRRTAAESERPRRGTHPREFLPSGEVDGLSILDLGAVGGTSRKRRCSTCCSNRKGEVAGSFGNAEPNRRPAPALPFTRLGSDGSALAAGIRRPIGKPRPRSFSTRSQVPAKSFREVRTALPVKRRSGKG